MDDHISGDLNVQIFIIVWHVNLKITYKVDIIDILTPLFSLNPIQRELENWIQLSSFRFENEIVIRSNFSSKEALKDFTTFMIDPSTNTVLDEYKGFKRFPWKRNQWCEKMKFVFEVKMQCEASAVKPIIWRHCTTEMKPPINTNGKFLTLESKTATHTVLNDQGVSCVVKRQLDTSNSHILIITPEKLSEDWNLLAVMLNENKKNIFEWYYLHTTNRKLQNFSGRCYQKFNPAIIFKIHELSTSNENVSYSDITAVTSALNKPHLNPANENRSLQQLNIKLMQYFVSDKFCDSTIQVGDQKIRTHKVVLAAGSPIWHDVFHMDETFSTIFINDFDYGTIKQLIEYMYTGIAKQPTEEVDQLLRASDTFGVTGLKTICEEQLIKTIEMKTVVNLLVLADRCKADTLFEKVVFYIRQNYTAFMKLEDSKSLMKMYPDLAFKLFAKIFRK